MSASLSDLSCLGKKKGGSTTPKFNEKYFHLRPLMYGTSAAWGGHSLPFGQDWAAAYHSSLLSSVALYPMQSKW